MCYDNILDLALTMLLDFTSIQTGGLVRFKPQDLSNTCWAFATLGLLHRNFFEVVGNQVEQR